MQLSEKALHDIKIHAIKEHPRESCGVILDGGYIAVENVADDPECDFRIDPKRWLELYKQGHIQAVVHSHPVSLKRTREQREIDPRTPSEQDMISQQATNIPWGIVATEGETCTDPIWLGSTDTLPLEGRTFIHGVTDCYSLIRDYYKLHHNTTLPDYPREYKWWEGVGNMYLDNFADAGFEEVDLSDRQPGDVLLIYLLSDVPNHAAVYLGGNEILHHYTGRLSKRDRLDKWEKRVTHCLRYTAA